MLVITRREGESVLIGDNIEINVTKISDGSVKIAITAPKETLILRKELYDEVGKENRIAGKADKALLKKLKK
ncbi:MAG: carbon storage regulator CsrA [Clostridium sp.]|nr:carbon storage regulator CsrA [Clostridium sp.]MDY3827357.1 carbon storage regulator CsrA [Clostridium sp.]